MAEWNEEWARTQLGHDYGEVFYKRAVGDLPEMESSKAAAMRVLRDLRPGETILDVGCGAGHYLRSIRSRGGEDVSYSGLDATAAYVELARKAFAEDSMASFRQGDIFALDVPDKSFDVVMCNNVLLHLPGIAKPLSELMRVARRRVLVRTLVGQKSYVVMDVAPQPDSDFDENGLPKQFHYLNIYSEAYVRGLLAREKRLASVSFELDRDFAASAIADTADHLKGAWDATRVIAGMQVSGAIILPWTFVEIGLSA